MPRPSRVRLDAGGDRRAIDDDFLDLPPPLAERADSFLLSAFLSDGITHRFRRESERYVCEIVSYLERYPV